jgi:hypothetical protein
MIGFSCIMPNSHKDVPTKYRLEQLDPKDDEVED